MVQRFVAVAAAALATGLVGSGPALGADLTTEEDFQEFYMAYLSAEGYKPEVDGDGDVKFKKEVLTYYIIVNSSDAEFFQLALPNIHQIESDGDRADALAAADYSNATSKVSKVFFVGDSVFVTVELFVASPEDFKDVFQRSMSAVLYGANNFIEQLGE